MILPGRLERIRERLACTRCSAGLDYSASEATCRACDTRFPIGNGRIYFVDVPERSDELDRVKGYLKRILGKYYYKVGITLLAPTYPFNFIKAVRRHLEPASQVIIDIGCGNQRLDKDVIGADLFDDDAVDLVFGLESLPFRNGSVDGVISRSVFERLPEPARVAGEVHRVVARDGLTIHLTPFLFPFLASPYNFYRFSHQDDRRLFAGWEVLEQYNATGPVTLMLSVFVEWLAAILGVFGPQVKAVAYLGLCGLLFPIKFLDFPFIRRESMLTLAPIILTVFRQARED